MPIPACTHGQSVILGQSTKVNMIVKPVDSQL